MGDCLTARFSAILLLAGCACLAGQPASAAKCNVALGGPAPSLAGTDLAGQTVDLGSMRGKWVYIDFWASWCRPCMRELPKVVELHQDLQSRDDFAVLSIALDDQSTLGELQNVTTKYQVGYPVVCDSAGWSSPHVQQWCVESIPTTYLIDPQGRVVERDIAPSEVRGYLSRTGARPVQQTKLTPPRQQSNRVMPAGFNAKHRVLRDSPTSGKRGMRDLQISLPSPRNGSPSRYQLVVRGEELAGSPKWVRYDLEFKPDSKRREFPFAVTIHEASGSTSTRLETGEKMTVRGPAADVFPGAQISYDQRESRLLFVLPLRHDLRNASYTAALFDPATQAFAGTLAADIHF